MAEHLRQRQVGLRHRDVAPQRLRDLVRRQRPLGEQPADLLARGAGAGAGARRSARRGRSRARRGRRARCRRSPSPASRAASRCRSPARAGGRAARRRPPPLARRSSGREMSGLDEMCLMRWSAPSTMRALLVVEDRVRRRVAGAVQDAQRAVAQLELGAVRQPPRHRRRRAPRAEGLRDAEQRVAHVLRDPVLGHHALGERVVGVHALLPVLDARREQVERRDLGARATREDRHEPEVVDVLVGDDDQLEVLDAMPARRPARARARPAPCPSSARCRSASAGRPR